MSCFLESWFALKQKTPKSVKILGFQFLGIKKASYSYVALYYFCVSLNVIALYQLCLFVVLHIH